MSSGHVAPNDAIKSNAKRQRALWQALHVKMNRDMKPKEVVEQWVECFNRADIDGLCNLYHKDAINHQVVTDPLEGIEAIRSLFEIEFSRATMRCNIEKIHEADDWAILEWSDPLELRGCVFNDNYFDRLTTTILAGCH